MGVLEIILIGAGLAMDAFAVSVVKGLGMQRLDRRYMLVIALCFGGFQALMPLAGWLLGSSFLRYIEKFDHWVAFGLLLIIGAEMIVSAVRGESEDEIKPTVINWPELLALSLATSIDALAVGVSLAITGVNIWMAIAIIGAVTFIITGSGVIIGNRFGDKYRAKAKLAGGIILIAIGLRILLEGLGVI